MTNSSSFQVHKEICNALCKNKDPSQGLSRWPSGKECAYQYRRYGFSPWVRKIPWSRKWQPAPVFLPGRFHGQRTGLATVHGSQSQTQLSDWAGTHTSFPESPSSHSPCPPPSSLAHWLTKCPWRGPAEAFLLGPLGAGLSNACGHSWKVHVSVHALLL